MKPYSPPILPNGWRELKKLGFFTHRSGLMVICTTDKEKDGNEWLHVSFSYKNKLPSYKDMKIVKKIFIGSKNKAIQVFPSDAEHVNDCPYCLHLFSCLSDDVLPDFRKNGSL